MLQDVKEQQNHETNINFAALNHRNKNRSTNTRTVTVTEINMSNRKHTIQSASEHRPASYNWQ